MSSPAGRKVGHSFMNRGTGPLAILDGRRRSDASDVLLSTPTSNKMAVKALLRTARLRPRHGRACAAYWDGEDAP